VYRVGDVPMKKFCIEIKNPIVNILILIGLSIFMSCVGFLISSVFSIEILVRLVKSPLVFVLNTLPLLIIMLFFYFLTSRLWASYFISGIFFLLINYVNRFKIKLRHEPFVPADILLGNESTKVLKISELQLNRSFYVPIVVFLLISLFLFLFVKSKKLKWPVKVIGPVLSVVLSLVLYNTVYSNVKLYDSFKIYGNKYSLVDTVQSKGFIYSFIVKAHAFEITEPEGYSKKYAEDILEKYKSSDTSNTSVKKRPHVFAIMSEAFWNIDVVPGLKFTQNNDPLTNFNSIVKESYSGNIITTVFGGGTADTEFSFLTGHSLAISDAISNPYVLYIRKNVMALPRIMEKENYTTTAFHPGYPWFYNRYSVYDYFGFNRRFFVDEMPDPEANGSGYVYDKNAVNFILNDFKKYLSKNSDSPYFNFTVTIQNHGPYAMENAGYPQVLSKESSIDEEYYYMVNNYVNGLKQCDEALGLLVKEFKEMNEPIVLLYFSDHLPYLGQNFAGFNAMHYDVGTSGSVEAYINTYKVPYFIWSNDAAKKLLKEQGRPVPVGKAPTISSNYLSLELMDYIGIKGNEYTDYLRDIRSKLPVLTKRCYQRADGNIVEKISDEENKIISDYRILQHYMMFDKN